MFAAQRGQFELLGVAHHLGLGDLFQPSPGYGICATFEFEVLCDAFADDIAHALGQQEIHLRGELEQWALGLGDFLALACAQHCFGAADKGVRPAQKEHFFGRLALSLTHAIKCVTRWLACGTIGEVLGRFCFRAGDAK